MADMAVIRQRDYADGSYNPELENYENPLLSVHLDEMLLERRDYCTAGCRAILASGAPVSRQRSMHKLIANELKTHVY